MPTEAEVDRISISVESNSTKAKDQLDSVRKSLTNLDKVAKSVNLSKIEKDLRSLDYIFSVFTEDRANGINTVADALTRIKNVRTLNLNRVNGQLNDLADAIIRIEPDKLESVASSLASIRGAGTGRISIPRITNAVGASSTVHSGTTTVSGTTETSVADNITATAEEVDRVTESSVERATTNLNSLSGVLSRLRSFGVSAAKAIGSGFVTVGRKVLSLATGPFRLLQSAIQRVISPIKNFFTMFKRRLLYRLINSIISTVTKAVKEGINNVYQYSKAINGTLAESMDKIATSFLYFKNSLGAMVAPLLNALAPVIDRLVDKAVDFLNIINQTIAKLTGASTWTKALKYPTEYAEEVDKSLKKIKNTILSIDEINPLNDNTDYSKKKTTLDYSKMFEEVSVDIDESPMMAKLERIRKTLSSLFTPIKTAWQKYGDPIMKKFQSIVEKIKTLWDKMLENLETSTVFQAILGLVDSIAGFIDQILGDIIAADDKAGGLKKTFELIDGIISGIINLFKTIIDKIREALGEGDRGERLAQSISDLVNEILGFINDIIADLTELFEDVDWGPIIDALTDINNGLKDLVKIIRDEFKKIWNDILKPILRMIIDDDVPGVLNLLAGAIEAIAGALKMLVSFQNFDPEGVIDGFKKLLEGLLNIGKGILRIFLGSVEKVINGIIAALNKLPFVNIDYIDLTGILDEPLGGEIASNYEQIAKNMYNNGGFGGGNKLNVNFSREYATGGIPPQGTAFIAGEAGPEIVADIGRRSGVMNVSQMSEGVAQGVRDANAEQNALLREQNSLLRVLIDKEFSATAVVSTDDIIAGLQRNNRRNGRTIVPVGV